MAKSVIKFFDVLEDHIRTALSHYPIIYAFVGGFGIVLFWKGVWETVAIFPMLHGPVSIIAGVVVLLLSGLFVSFFIGKNIIISGLNREKKLAEKTESEVHAEKDLIQDLITKLDRLERGLERVESSLNDKK